MKPLHILLAVMALFVGVNTAACAQVLGLSELEPNDDAAVDAAISPDGKTDCLLPPTNIVAWWDGENVGEDIVGGYDSTAQFGLPGLAPGVVGMGHAFSTEQLLEFGKAPAPELFTLESWILLENKHEDWIGLYGKFGESGLCTYNQRLTFWEGNLGGVTGNTGLGVTDLSNEWHHIATTWDGMDLRTYIDGVLDGVTKQTESVALPTTAHLGGMVDRNLGNQLRDHFAGVIDEFTIYNRALSADEIGAIFAAGSAGKCK